jgi:hypothetical protein
MRMEMEMEMEMEIEMGMFGECDSMIRMRSSILSMPFHLVGAKFI